MVKLVLQFNLPGIISRLGLKVKESVCPPFGPCADERKWLFGPRSQDTTGMAILSRGLGSWWMFAKSSLYGVFFRGCPRRGWVAIVDSGWIPEVEELRCV